VVEDLEDMPAGTLGFRVSGRITRDEYFQMLDPVRELLERGQKVSFLVVTEPDFHGLDLPALWEDVKAAGSVGLKHRSAWDRLAVVTDKEWMLHAISAFGWLSPGELRVFDPRDLDEAKAWTGGAAAAQSG
jgi:SpoIIAA-like